MRMSATQHKILRYVWKKRETVRKDISRDLGINPSTVTRNLKGLLDEGVVEIRGVVSTSETVGRKSEVIALNDSWRKIVGISVERGEVTALLVSMTGRILKQKREFVEVKPDEVIETIVRVGGDLIREGDVLAVAVPGIVSNGVVEYSMALELRKFDLKGKLEERVGKKVFVINDANAAVANFSDKASSLVCFLISVPYNLMEEVGIGAGIWIDGKLHRGSHNAAGETGSGVRIVEGGGTIEDLKSGRFSAEDMGRFVEETAEKMAVLSQFVDPELVVISGDVDLLPEKVRESIVEEMRRKLLSDIEIIVDLDGERSVARGAAMALINEAMSDPTILEEYIWGESLKTS